MRKSPFQCMGIRRSGERCKNPATKNIELVKGPHLGDANHLLPYGPRLCGVCTRSLRAGVGTLQIVEETGREMTLVSSRQESGNHIPAWICTTSERKATA